jgi:hypothetical protein
LVPVPTLPPQTSRPPSTSTSPPTLAGQANGTQPPEGCYWAGPAYPKSGKGKGKGYASPKTKSKKSHHSKKKSSSEKVAKGRTVSSKGTEYVEDVFTEYTEDEDNSYHYDSGHGDWYWCPPGYGEEGTMAPSWPKGSSGGHHQKPTGDNIRPMHMHTAPTHSPPITSLGGDEGATGSGVNNAIDGTIYTQNDRPVNNYWAIPPASGSSETSPGTTTSDGGGYSDGYGYAAPYTPGGGPYSSSHPDSGVTGVGVSNTKGYAPPSATTTTSIGGNMSSSPSSATTAILIAAVAGGSVLALVIGFVVRRKVIDGDEEDAGGDKVVVETQSGDHSVSTISHTGNIMNGVGNGNASGGSGGTGSGGGPPMHV